MADRSILQGKRTGDERTRHFRHSRNPIERSCDLATFSLDDLGIIRDCGSACEQIFGYGIEATSMQLIRFGRGGVDVSI